VDSSGAPVVGARVSVGLRMPDHADHTLPGTVGVETAGGPYDVQNLNLTMPGLYNITVEVTRETAEADSVFFQFCVARKGN
jgi:YtkA-like